MDRLTKSSQYTGVTWERADNRWRARVRHNNVRHYVGNFIDEILAAKAVDRFIKKHGLNKKLNFQEHE